MSKTLLQIVNEMVLQKYSLRIAELEWSNNVCPNFTLSRVDKSTIVIFTTNR